MHTLRLITLFTLLCGLLASRAEGDERNLQVLPLRLSRLEVLEVMRLMTIGLGTECTLCHPSERNDYLSDEIPAKQVARAMMRMVEASSPDLDWARPPEALCFRCHEGSDGPLCPWRHAVRLTRLE